MKIIFLTPHPEEGSSSRVRVYQFVPELQARGHVCQVHPFLSANAFRRRKLRASSQLEHMTHMAAGILRRLRDIPAALRSDVVFIHREASPYGPPLYEKLLSLLGCKLIVDFDDALFLPQPEKSSNRLYRWMANPSRLRRTLNLAAHAIAGNSYLAEFARQHCDQVTVIPSVIDCRRFTSREARPPGQPTVIGWMGSPSTAGYLRIVQRAISRLAEKYPIQLHVVGATLPAHWRDVPALFKEFELDTELEDLQSFDIGIMPLTDDEWAKGKCAFKALQYMSVGVPVVSSPVGAIRDIIHDGKNGLFAATEDDWFHKLETLVLQPELRRQIGERGRHTVAKNYSVEAALPRLLFVLNKVTSESAALPQSNHSPALLNSAQNGSCDRRAEH
jgi:glycosyltransferase involved in cell wall biosynthesis